MASRIARGENPSSHEKYLSYTEALKPYPDIQNDLIRIQLSRKRQMEASEATTEVEIRNLYGTGDPAVLRAVAAPLSSVGRRGVSYGGYYHQENSMRGRNCFGCNYRVWLLVRWRR